MKKAENDMKKAVIRGAVGSGCAFGSDTAVGSDGAIGSVRMYTGTRDGGFILSPSDERDYPICMAYEDGKDTELPQSFVTEFQPPYEKQLCGNCVAQALANVMECAYHALFGVHEDFSVGFIYGNRDEGEYSGEGMTGYLACGHLTKDGDVKACVFENPGSAPSIISKVNEFKAECPEWRSYAYIPPMYIRTKDKTAVKKFILKYGIPVMAVCRMSDISHGSGYHAMALYGWDGETAIMQNSWGERSSLRTVELEFDKIIEFWLMVPFMPMVFDDVGEECFAYSAVLKCAEFGFMMGYPDGSFRPEAEITRAEFAAAIYRYMKKERKI